MGKVDEVLAEEWVEDCDGSIVGVADFCSVDGGPVDRLRTSVAVLGKRALKLILKHEWCGPGDYDGNPGACPECLNLETAHEAGCELAAIVAEVRARNG